MCIRYSFDSEWIGKISMGSAKNDPILLSLARIKLLINIEGNPRRPSIEHADPRRRQTARTDVQKNTDINP
jgi:hypothetical protein